MNVFVVLISWLTPNITSTVLSKQSLDTDTYYAIYVPIVTVAVTFGTSLFMPALYVFR